MYKGARYPGAAARPLPCPSLIHGVSQAGPDVHQTSLHGRLLEWYANLPLATPTLSRQQPPALSTSAARPRRTRQCHQGRCGDPSPTRSEASCSMSTNRDSRALSIVLRRCPPLDGTGTDPPRVISRLFPSCAPHQAADIAGHPWQRRLIAVAVTITGFKSTTRAVIYPDPG